MWWPGPNPDTWNEGHSSLGTTATGVTWALADGEAGGPRNAKTYILVATGEGVAVDSLRLTVVVENGPVLERVYTNVLTPTKRITFDVEAEFPEVGGPPVRRDRRIARGERHEDAARGRARDVFRRERRALGRRVERRGDACTIAISGQEVAP